uniref:Cystatin fetuin-A-type domain-containing protein n=1 Tax=Gopherus agassizii TaxID=38772 RepID=A0A452H198_9SAUR
MKVLVALLLLVQLLSCKVVPFDPFQPLHPRFLDCDDPESEEAAAIAVDYINAHHHHGYKYALNSIEKIKVLRRRPTGEIFDLELDLLETVCHIVNPLPVENCTVRPLTHHAVEADCDVKLLKLDGRFSVLSTQCHSTPDSAEDVTQICPDCPILALLNDTRVITAVDLALAQYNRGQDGAFFKLLEIGRAQIQVTVEAMILAILQREHPSCDYYATHICLCLQTSFACTKPDGFLFQPGVTHHHLIHDHLGGQLPTVVQGFTHHDLRHFHHGSVPGKSESSSAEASVGLPPPVPVVKRSVVPTILAPIVGPGPKPPVCPGRIRYFQV